jgi:cell division septation protein DedD
MVRRLICAAALAFSPALVQAQAQVAVNPAYARAQSLVNEGNAAAGRAIVDSMIAIAAPGSTEYAEAVYWRGVLAATAADAEMDYRRIVVDFPLSPRVEDALIRLAQLEMARANYDGALRHLNRLVAEHPQSPSRGRAGYWMARALFDKNDIQGGCTAIVDALARTSESDVELRNQITYLNQRCAGVVLAGPAETTAGPTTTPPVTVPQTTAPAAAPAAAPPPAPAPVRESTTVVTTPTPTPTPAPPPARAVTPPAPAPVTPRDEARPAGAWSVQVAAYNVKSQADAMVARLKTNGYEARVDGTAAPFRVRIGRYATQGQASAVQRSLKAKKIDGFVVQADTR